MPGYASLLGGPRGDLGYLAFAVFIGDNGTFCLCVMAPPWDKQFRSLRDPGGYQRLAARLPGMGQWLDIADPVTPVLPMGQPRNTLRQPPPITGLVAIGDAQCHTNPTFAFGASLAIWHAVVLANLANSASDVGELGDAFARAIGPDTLERFRAVSAEDADRVRMWSGQPIDVTDRDDSMPMFLRSVVYRVAPSDPELLRAVARRIDALDPVDSLAQYPALLDRAESLYRDGAKAPQVPPRSALLAALEQS
jgi:2-polyprenyl-6-methoxyphenol hydroxylase-like FAD-dependent oxidoreductase